MCIRDSDTLINKITDEERADAIKRMQAEAIYARDSLTGPATIIGYGLMAGATLDDIEHWPEALEKITTEDLNRVTQLYLNPDEPYQNPPVTGFMIPQKPAQTPTEEGE